MKNWLLTEFRKAPRLWSIALIIAFAFLAYGNSLDAGFHYDDSHHVVGNPFVHDAKFIGQYFTRPDMFSALPGHRMYRPVLLATFNLNYQWGGYDPLHWRLTAIALHALVAVGVYLLVLSLSRSLDQRSDGEGSGGALVAALVFAIHPLFSETVDYASARSSLLATGAVVWAMLAHRGAQAQGRAAVRLALLLLSLALFAMAFLTKEIAVVYPALLLVVAWLERRGWTALLPALVVAALLLYIRKLVLGSAVIDFVAREASRATADANSGGARPILWNLFTQARVIVGYLLLFLVPYGLTIHRQVRVSDSLFEGGVIGGGLVILGLLLVAIRERARRPLLALGILWFFIALAPTSSIIPLNQVMNEHRTYLPGVGLAFIVAFAWGRIGFAYRVPALAGIGLALLVTTWQRNEDWNDSLRLWESAAEVSPECGHVHNALGGQLRRRGAIEDSERAFRAALRFDPESWEATFNLGTLALYRGRVEEDPEQLADAELWLERSLVLRPSAERSRWYLAEVYLEQKRYKEARREFHRMSLMSPRFFELTRYPLARMAQEEGDEAGARAHYEEALETGIDPVAAMLGLADLEAKGERLAEAAAQARRAMQERPHDPRPYVFLARLFAGSVQAPGYLFEAERLGYMPTAEDRAEILRGGA